MFSLVLGENHEEKKRGFYAERSLDFFLYNRYFKSKLYRRKMRTKSCFLPFNL